jgi:hypothetical protein
MQLEHSHKLGKDEVIRRIDVFVDELMRSQFPAGVTIKNASKTWTGGSMEFSFKPSKGFISAGTVSGNVRVNANSVEVNLDLPPLITKFVSEQMIRDHVNSQFDQLFRQS